MRARLWLLTAVVSLLAAGVAACQLPFVEGWVQDEYQAALPKTAVNVQYKGARGGPDWYVFLKAEISEDEFLAYVEHFEMTLHTPARVYTDSDHWLDWQVGGMPDWWDASEDLTGTYVHQEGDHWLFAKYEGGMLYLRGFSH